MTVAAWGNITWAIWLFVSVYVLLKCRLIIVKHRWKEIILLLRILTQHWLVFLFLPFYFCVSLLTGPKGGSSFSSSFLRNDAFSFRELFCPGLFPLLYSIQMQWIVSGPFCTFNLLGTFFTQPEMTVCGAAVCCNPLTGASSKLPKELLKCVTC